MNDVIPVNNKISHNSTIKIASFDPKKRYTKPHRHNKYLELVYFSKASGYHYMDDNKYRIQAPILFIIHKEMVHHWEIANFPVGYVIIIKKEFIEHTLDQVINKQIYALGQQAVVAIEENRSIDVLFQILVEELRYKEGNQTEVLEGLLKALFRKLLNNIKLPEYAPPNHKLSQFNSLLDDKLKNDVNYYASKLHTTSQNLNRICKKEYGRPVSKVISNRIIKEAKRLLQYNAASVSEIAFHFEFNDSSHFIKYFKRHTGVTPLTYRKNRV